MDANLAAPPVLSTANDDVFQASAETGPRSQLSDEELRVRYEIARTAAEIREGAWTRIALQFPDHMLVDAPRAVELLEGELQICPDGEGAVARRIHILADTSYSACCVDEVAAEHVDADVVVHYGRTCLSPTSRLPVIYVYTSHALDHEAVARAFEAEFGAKEARVVVMADLTFQDHVDGLVAKLQAAGYANVLATDVVRDPAGLIPNRRIRGSDLDRDAIRAYSLFHVAEPPPSLLLALHCRFASLHVLTPGSSSSSSSASSSPSLENPTVRTAGLLRRRFARVLSLASAGVIGILVNTLSVSNYLSSLDLLRAKIAEAGKKSYTVVVGKLNPAKLANFAEVEGWVVVGCWESGLIEDDAGYWRPVVTPFELEVALTREDQRTWGGEWWGGTERLRPPPGDEAREDEARPAATDSLAQPHGEDGTAGGVEDDESLPPEFDLRTGKLVGHSRPMRLAVRSAGSGGPEEAPAPAVGGGAGGVGGVVATRAAGTVASIKGVASPGAEFLRSQRTWQGLGSDFEAEASTLVEEGRSGIARGYRVEGDGGNGDGDGGAPARR